MRSASQRHSASPGRRAVVRRLSLSILALTNGEAPVTRRAPPTRDAKPNSQPKAAPTFTLSEADITSTRAVPRPRLPGVLGATAAAQAFGNAGAASPSD